MTKRRNKIIAFVLSVLLMFCNLSQSVLAAETEQNILSENEDTSVNVEEQVLPEDTAVLVDDSRERREIVETECLAAKETITAMDERGNVYSVESESGRLETAMTRYQRTVSPKIVNFNIQGNSVTEYTECGTGNSGYTNGMYGADAAYLGEENGKVKFMLAGVIGLVDSSLVQVVDFNNALSVNYYIVSDGRLFHYITTNITKDSYASVLDNGPAPSFLCSGIRYYSYDGHYFYSGENFGNMIDDYNDGNRNHAINASNPYYNYYQYLPFRSQTNYTAGQIDGIIADKAGNSSSKMLNSGNAFINYQNTYGVNALLAVGIAANESWWGKSSIAMNKNNLFGLNAVDSSPGESADTYSSPDSCIKTFAKSYMSEQYLNPGNWVYSGGYLGNKGSGMNVMYASDPYWGEKNASIAWIIDKACGNKDLNKYTVAIKDMIGNEHTNWNVRNEPGTSSRIIYTTKGYSNQAFIVLETKVNDGFYKIQSDAALTDDRTGIAGSGEYNFEKMYAYISQGAVQIISKGEEIENGVSVPKELENAVLTEVHVQEIGWQTPQKNGDISGSEGKNLGLEAIKVRIQGISDLGIKYSVHVAGDGWQPYVADGAVGGTEGQAKTLEAFRMELTGEQADNYILFYRAYVQEYGWLDWTSNGGLAGTQGYGYALRAIQVALFPKGTAAPGNNLVAFYIQTIPIEYQAHVQDIGWQNAVSNGELAGTTGENKKIEALSIAVKNTSKIGVRYRGYVQDVGWTQYVSDGNVIGTTGQNKRLEAIQIELTGDNATNYDIYYRVHVQDKGWLDWAKNGNPAGTKNYALKIEGVQIVILPKGNPPIGSEILPYMEKETGIKYMAHVQDIGWQDYVENGQLAGTTGRNLQVESLKMELFDAEYTGGVEYCTHVQDIGWQDYVENNKIAGTVGQNKQVEAVKIRLTGIVGENYDVYYRVHASEFGWLDWAKNGNSAGSEGYGRQVEAIEVRLVKKGEAAPGETKDPFYKKDELVSTVGYQAHVSDIGWQIQKTNGELAGTTGRNLQMEALKIKLISQKYAGDIEYCAHVEDIGWQSYVKNGELAGTTGQNKQIEAIKIRLIGNMNAKYDIFYRVHASDFGWMGWTKNGEAAGSQGYGRQVEAIEIKLVEKGGAAPGDTANSFFEKGD